MAGAQSKNQKVKSSESTDPIIEVRGLRAAFGETVVLDDVTFDVQRGEIVVLLGGSGCGKSTLMRHMIGLLEPAAGSVTIEGTLFASATAPPIDDATRRSVLRRIGVSYQSGALFGSMSLAENVSVALEEFTDLPAEAIHQIARMKLQLVGLCDAADKLPSEVSGGMQKRAALARAMALDPEIIFLDEPSAGLDPTTSAELDALMLQLRSLLNITFVVVTHELDSVFAIADRCIMLDKSVRGILAVGDPQSLRDDSSEPIVTRFFRRQAREKPL